MCPNCYVNRTSFRLSLPAIGLVVARKLFPNKILPRALPSIQTLDQRTHLSFRHSLVEHAVFPHRRTCSCNQPLQNNSAFWITCVLSAGASLPVPRKAKSSGMRRFILFHGKRHPSEMGKVRGRRLSQSPDRSASSLGEHSVSGSQCPAVSLQAGTGNAARRGQTYCATPVLNPKPKS